MEIKVKDLYQWDKDVSVEIISDDIDEVDFKNPYGDTAFVMPITKTDTGILVNIPNILLTYPLDIKMYVVKSNQTRSDHVFGVNARQKPSDYIYTETEILSFKKLEEELINKIDNEIKSAAKEIQENVHDGVDGVDGKDGKSAYQYAQDGGFEGTEEEFANNLARVVLVLDGNGVEY